MLDSFRKKLLQIVRKQVLRGDNNFCPICGYEALTFLPYGVRKRPNAQCPGCKSLERQRLVWLYVQNHRLLEGCKSLLHVSPEKVLFEKFRAISGLEYVPADKFDPGYRYAAGTINLDVTDIQFPDNHFDAIMCIHVLEHVPADHKAMQELLRVLKPGGWAIILVPIDKNLQQTLEDPAIQTPEARLAAYGQEDHVRQYGMDYADRLRAAGFTVKVDDFIGQFSAEEQFRMGLPKEEDIYFCTKGA